MKTIHRIYYFLFSVILLGMFASFAQNDYSSILLKYPYLLLACLFLIEMFYTTKMLREKNQAAVHSFFECLALGLLFSGVFFMSMHWAGATPLIVAGSVTIVILYSVFGTKALLTDFRNEKGMAFFIFCLTFSTILAIVAYALKLQHQTLAGILTVASGIFSLMLLLLILMNVKINYQKEEIGLRNYLKQIKTKLVLSFVFFSFWTIYFTLVSFGIAPKLYSLANPHALEKMYQEQNPAAEVYRNNYQHFLDNWNMSKTNQPENLSSKK